MTAIFAYVKDRTAFIAADTKRSDGLGLLPLVPATKVFRWSEHVLMAQTGAARGLSKLIGSMLVNQPNRADFTTVSGIVTLYKGLRLSHYEDTVKSTGSEKLSGGTIVVVNAAHESEFAGILTLDFATEKVTAVGASGDAYADGSNPQAFQTIANAELMNQADCGGLQLDDWALRCIDQAIAGHKAVGWPADLIVSREEPAGGRTTTYRRVVGRPQRELDAFRIA